MNQCLSRHDHFSPRSSEQQRLNALHNDVPIERIRVKRFMISPFILCVLNFN